jgi:ribonucleoside-diphosphate reductase alpha chain
MPFSENSLTVLRRRYLKKDPQGKAIETPDDMLRRVAENVASADKKYNKDADTKKTAQTFYNIMYNNEFMACSPTLMNAGRVLQQLSACFVLPIEDSMEQIFETLKNAALIHKSGGGTGFSFSRIRPKNDFVSTTSGVASGPISFIKVYNAATEQVKQGGTRRGANMGILRVDHPDIEDFISCKEDDTSITNFNLSVAITDKFMHALKTNKEYDLINPRSGKFFKKMSAKYIFDKIIDGAWRNGEPGVVFIDKINKFNPTPAIGAMESTNPCGEQPLLPYESCNLGSINLESFVVNGKINWDRLNEVTKQAVHFMDNVIDMNKYPLPEIEKITKANRKIGLGVMGWAHMLILLKISYNSEEAIKLAEKVMKFIRDAAVEKSVEIAKERGNFPNFDKSIFPQQRFKHLRNATLTTIAPTGSISMISDTSSGIEPVFSLVYVKNVMDNDRLLYINNLFENAAKKLKFYSKELMDKIADGESIHTMKEIPDIVKKAFTISHDISPEWHIKMQAAFQKYTDNAVSKTINFPNNATKEDIRKTYLLAYDTECKGLTVYRDGSRSIQVVEFKKKKEETKPEVIVKPKEPRNRQKIIQGVTSKISTGCGNFYLTINEDDDGPVEVFAHLGKTGGCASAQTEAISRLISIALRSGIGMKEIIEQIENIRCPMPTWQPEGMVLSCPDAIAKVLKNHLKLRAKLKENGSDKLVEEVQTLKEFINETNNQTPKNAKKKSMVDNLKIGNVSGICPDCGGPVILAEGCATCPICGFSKCGG